VYANQGIVAITDHIFPDPLESIEISTKSGQTTLTSLQLHTLKSVGMQDAIAWGADA
jgi:fructan beta-fructosidase